MRYSKKDKNKIKLEMVTRLQDGSWSLGTFADSHGMDRKTLRRWITQDDKLNTMVEQFNNNRKEAEKSERAAKKKEKRTGQEQEPFSTTQVENEKDEDEGTAVVTTRSLDIKTIDDALKVAEVDLDVWEVERSKINSWEVTIAVKNTEVVGKIKQVVTTPETYTNFQVTVWLRRIAGAALALKGLLDKIESKSPICPKIDFNTKSVRDRIKSRHIKRELEISLSDIHLGLRAYAGDSDVDWNVFDAEAMTMEVLEKLIILAEPYGPFERIIMPFGNDFLHSDNVYNTTTAGTVQPEADAWKHTLIRGEYLGIAMIDRLKKVSPVKVYIVPGNHAMHTEICMGRTLFAWYHNDENVEIDAGFSSFKFHDYGVNLIGFEHGHSIRQTLRLAGLMANSCRLLWEKARYCEWHLGDQHRKGSGRPSTMAEQGVSVEFLPSLVPANSWHKIHAFNYQKRAGMAFVWDKTAGPIARVQANIDSYTSKIMR